MNHKERKERPIYSGVLMYFPDALMAVANLSLVANEQHNPGTPLHWDRSKSKDEADALVRHLLESGSIDSDGIRHTAKVAWRSLSLLQKELEKANDNKEVFKDIPNWEGFYQVSNLGRVKSLARKWSPQESILNPTISYDGYLKVSLRANKVKQQMEINRLVALTFIDKDYVSKKLYCDHINRNKKDNTLNNLRLVSARVNSSNNGRDGLTGAHKHGKNWQSAITIDKKQLYLGTFKTEFEAHNKYKEALALLQKEIENENI